MSGRLVRLRRLLEREGLDGLLVGAPGEEGHGREAQAYLAGFTGSAGVLLVTRERALLAVDSRYWEQAEQETAGRGVEVVRVRGAGREWLPAMLRDGGIAGGVLGVSPRDLTYAGYLGVAAAIGELPEGERPELRPAEGLIDELRRVKDAEELAALQCAVDIADRALGRLLGELSPGMTELEAAARFERYVREEGGSGVSFPSIIAGGAWSALPHAQPRDVPLPAGAPIVLDVGAKYRGYCSDLTRTVVLGEPDARFREIYGIVLAAQEAAIAAARPGMRAAEVDAIARGVIAGAGYGDAFGHGLGHGVGLAVHEDPYLGPSSDHVLEAGMVFTIEPGIYVPGWGGVRIEDIVVLEDGRARVLGHAPKLRFEGA
ncbi:aminopeptidase P family protein [Tepidiforma sp.]|uniref:aminopeptidase P family protein n=1 Tax=Tepidiforma sp. TaxID=2682230 RepID=UPI002ADD84A5|nr:aminopeptidase P family protein [Tepidiforma sp.]